MGVGGLYWYPGRHFMSTWWRACWGALCPWLSTIGCNFTPFAIFLSLSIFPSLSFSLLFFHQTEQHHSFFCGNGAWFRFFFYNPFHDFTQYMSLSVYITPVFCIFLYPNTLTNLLPLESVFCAMWLTVPLSVSLAPLHLKIISELVFTLHTIPDLLHQSFFHHWINTHDNYCSLAIVTFRWTITDAEVFCSAWPEICF